MQNILNIKYKLEDQAKTEFMTANQILHEEEEKLESLTKRKAGYEEEVRQLLQKNLQVERIKENQEKILFLKQKAFLFLLFHQLQQLPLLLPQCHYFYHYSNYQHHDTYSA